MRSLFLTRLAKISAVGGLVALVASPVFAQSAEPLRLAQMMHSDDKGMQGKGMQGTPDKSMPDKGMQGMPDKGMPQQSAPAMPGQMGGMGQSMMPGMMPGMMMGSGMPGDSMMPMMMQGRMDAYVEGRIAFLQAELRITDAQMPAWHEFANILRANSKRAAEARAAQPQRTGTSVADRLDDQERSLSVRLDNVRALKPAYAKLYAALDDKQKKTADDVMPMLLR